MTFTFLFRTNLLEINIGWFIFFWYIKLCNELEFPVGGRRISFERPLTYNWANRWKMLFPVFSRQKYPVIQNEIRYCGFIRKSVWQTASTSSSYYWYRSLKMMPGKWNFSFIFSLVFFSSTELTFQFEESVTLSNPSQIQFRFQTVSFHPYFNFNLQALLVREIKGHLTVKMC